MKKLFGVDQAPVIVLLDSKGIVVDVFGDYFPTKIKASLKKLGMK